MPTLEQHLPQLAKAKIFTIVDAKDGFYQMKLHPDSTELTTFWTPLGRFKYLRVPQGISCAPEEYQRRQVEAYEGLCGVLVVADDTLVFGSGDTIEEARKDHDKNLRQLFERARQVGLKFNRGKLQLCLPEVTYMGHIISCEGVRADPSKIEAITNMPSPKSVKETQRFLGMVNYLLPFLPNLAAYTAPLRDVIKRRNHFEWMDAQEVAFQRIKQLLTQAPTLAFYDAKKEVTIQTDATDQGVGAILTQEGKVIAYHSHAFTEAEKGYVAMEKECLAIVSACLKFDHLIYGKPGVVVQTDHLPLIRIFEKPLEGCPKRLQRMRLTLQRFDLKLQHIPGNKNVVADTLSRRPVQPRIPTARETALRIEFEATRASEGSRISDLVLEEIRRHSDQDQLLTKLRRAIKEQWPPTALRDPELTPFKPFKDDLVCDGQLIFKGQACYIPRAFRANML